MDQPISRRSVLKGLGIAVGTAAFGVSPSRGEAVAPSGRCYIYLDHAARNHSPLGQWVVGALLVGDPRIPRQILRRAKRHRLASEERQIAEITARQASSSFKQYFYRRLGAGGGGLTERPLIELYGVHTIHAVLDSQRDEVGRFQLRMLQSLLRACDPGRFGEVYVYYNLPSLHLVSEKEFRAELLQGVRQGTGVQDVWEHPSVWARPDGVVLADEGIQVADFVTYALYQKYQWRNARWYNMIRPRIRQEISGVGLLRPFFLGR